MTTKTFLPAAISLTFSLSSFAQSDAVLISTNANAPVHCSRSITINASPQKVWDVLTNIIDWYTWQPKIKKPKLTGELKPSAEFTWQTGGASIRSTIHSVIPNKIFGWTGKTLGMYAIHNWTLNEVNGNTIVTVDESMEGMLARWFKKSFNKNLATDMQYWLELLKQTSER
jgi:uncharacterized protein YndB with AHSA1/START domain